MTHAPSFTATSARGSSRVDAVLDLLADLVAERVIARLGEVPQGGHEYYDQRLNPLGKRRFLEAARRGAFPSTKQGKLVLARRTDVDAWIASGKRDARVSTASTAEGDALSDEDLMAASGIVLTPPRQNKPR
jgi:hypothetical protein